MQGLRRFVPKKEVMGDTTTGSSIEVKAHKPFGVQHLSQIASDVPYRLNV